MSSWLSIWPKYNNQFCLLHRRYWFTWDSYSNLFSIGCKLLSWLVACGFRFWFRSATHCEIGRICYTVRGRLDRHKRWWRLQCGRRGMEHEIKSNERNINFRSKQRCLVRFQYIFTRWMLEWWAFFAKHHWWFRLLHRLHRLICDSSSNIRTRSIKLSCYLDFGNDSRWLRNSTFGNLTIICKIINGWIDIYRCWKWLLCSWWILGFQTKGRKFWISDKFYGWIWLFN